MKTSLSLPLSLLSFCFVVVFACKPVGIPSTQDDFDEFQPLVVYDSND
jgi:hypothetical protein